MTDAPEILEPPESVRIASRHDVGDLFRHMVEDAAADNGYFETAPVKVATLVNRLCAGPHEDGVTGIVGIIREDGRIVGSTGIVLAQAWYSEEWHLSEIWVFVHPDFRRGRHYDRDLADFAEWHRQDLSRRTGAELMLQKAIVTRKRLDAKTRLWKRRAGAELVGSVFWMGAR